MSQPNSGLAQRVRSSVEDWIRNQLRESVRCRGCRSEVTPFESHCPKCGQANPAKVSTIAVVYLAIAFVILAVVLSFVFSFF
jgi:hypothetical protein